ncbi:LytR/AlgR family response regulator transcription factor [Chondrinema litorale]|uniref:LytR/AlgR family response regulator transcription factor n=1 Tax=Chondrinema litorale TaxID=2994555 RepID=UPI0025436880|nr:LytTR family DNA-binding domain-containing protein [Chondrinema litorale]UZR95422.1 LytTR family DNA-binding domain-containing protein [Chondrinema litorale]
MIDKLDCIIVDDDSMSLTILEALIEKTDFLNLKAKFVNAIDTAAFLRKHDVDLIFLDVEMPEMSGLELLSTLTKKPQIILTTSNTKYAIDAFDYDVTDYLLKPIENYARFLKAANKALDSCKNTNAGILTEAEDQSFYVKVDSLLVKIDFTEILWIEAFGDYVKIFTDQKMFLVYTTLRTVEDKLPSTVFMRVHRSYIIRIDKIENIDQGNLQVKNKIIPVSNTYKPKLMDRIQTL